METAHNKDSRGNIDSGKLTLFLQLSTVAAIASILFRTFADSDTWWQIAIGRDILANWAVPHVDHYAAAALGRSYHDSHWLFQVILALADRMGGMKAVGLVVVALWALILCTCYQSVRQWVSPTASCLLVFVVVMACSNRFIPRPDIVTCLMIALYYLLLQSGRYLTIPQLLIFGILQLIWSNSHGLFVIGPFMACVYLSIAILRRAHGQLVELASLANLLIVLLIASVITPHGYQGWLYAATLLKESGPAAPAFFKYIGELATPFGPQALSSPDTWFFILLTCGLLATSVPLLLRRQISLSRFLITTALFMTAVTARRNIPLFALTAAPLIAENFFRLSFKWPRTSILTWVCTGFLLIFSCLPISSRFNKWFFAPPTSSGIGVVAAAFPSGFPAFLSQIRFTGQIYNSNNLGGFCLYHGIRPLTDGRWEVYDQNLLSDILRAPLDQGAWEQLLESFKIKGILLSHGSYETIALYPRLNNDNRFKLVYTDGVASFWLRTDDLR